MRSETTKARYFVLMCSNPLLEDRLFFSLRRFPVVFLISRKSLESRAIFRLSAEAFAHSYSHLACFFSHLARFYIRVAIADERSRSDSGRRSRFLQHERSSLSLERLKVGAEKAASKRKLLHFARLPRATSECQLSVLQANVCQLGEHRNVRYNRHPHTHTRMPESFANSNAAIIRSIDSFLTS